MHALNRLIVSILKGLAVLSLCSMSLLTVIDAAGRYLLNRPILGSVELVELLMVCVIFSSIPLMTRSHGHIVVDSFSHFFSMRALQWQNRVGSLLAMVVSGFLSWIAIKKALSTAEYGDMTAMLHIPLAPFVYFMAILLALDAIYHAMNAVTAMSAETGSTDHD